MQSQPCAAASGAASPPSVWLLLGGSQLLDPQVCTRLPEEPQAPVPGCARYSGHTRGARVLCSNSSPCVSHHSTIRRRWCRRFPLAIPWWLSPGFVVSSKSAGFWGHPKCHLRSPSSWRRRVSRDVPSAERGEVARVCKWHRENQLLSALSTCFHFQRRPLPEMRVCSPDCSQP